MPLLVAARVPVLVEGGASSRRGGRNLGRDVSGVEDRDAAGREDVVDFPGTFDGLSGTDGECGIGVVEGIDLSAGEDDDPVPVSMAALRMRRELKVQLAVVVMVEVMAMEVVLAKPRRVSSWRMEDSELRRNYP